jgi:hypothetical protein
MDDFDAPARSPGQDGGEPGAGGAPPVLRLGAQTLDAARGVNRHHELRMAQHYARLAQAVETPAEGAADADRDASDPPA